MEKPGPRLRSMSDMPLGFLWNKLVSSNNDKDRYILLKALHYKLQEQPSFMGVITPDGIQCIICLLKGSHKDEVKILMLKVLCHLLKDPAIMKLLNSQGLLKGVTDLLDVDDNPPFSAGPASMLKRFLISDVIQFLTRISLKHMKPLLCTGIVNKLVAYLDQENSWLFTCTAKGQAFLEKSTKGKELVGECHSMERKTLMNIYYNYFSGLDIKQILVPKVGYKVSLYDTSDSDSDRDILQEMTDHSFLWPDLLQEYGIANLGVDTIAKKEENDLSPEKSTKEVIGELGDLWQDIVVTEVVDAACFWAHIGADSPSVVEKVQETLKSWPQNFRQMLRIPPKVGVFVAAPSEALGVYRAQVIAVDDKEAQLFSLDYGFLSAEPWNTCFLLTPDMNLKLYPPQARLCCLKGACPSPMDMDLVLLILKSLSTFSQNEVLNNEFFAEKNILRILLSLVNAPVFEVKKDVIVILSNLVKGDTLKGRLLATGLLELLVGFLETFGTEENMKVTCNREIVRVSLICIINFLYGCDEIRTMFCDELDGLPLLIGLSEDKFVGLLALKALRVFLGNTDLTVARSKSDHIERRLPRSHRRSTSQRSRSRSRHSGEENTVASGLSALALRHGDSSDDDLAIGGGLNNFTLSPKKQEDALESPERTAKVEEPPTRLVPVTPPEAAQSSSRTLRDDLEGLYDATSSDPNCNTYNHGYAVDFMHDYTHHFVPETVLTRIKDTYLAMVIVSLLNTRSECRVYVGITQDGHVQGIRTTRDQREGFRQGIDRLMRDGLEPIVMHNQYNIHFHQVIRHGKLVAHVAELWIKASLTKVLYSTRGVCYLRRHGEIYIITPPELHARKVKEVEESYLRQIERLKKELDALQLRATQLKTE